MEQSKICRTDIAIFLIVVIIFGMGLLAFYPGLLTSDGVDQLQQAANNNYVDAHPVLHTFIIGSITKIFGTIAGVGIVQIILFAFIWILALKTIRKQETGGLNTIFQYIFTIIICLIPLNFTYSITLWKDILYSYSIFSLVVMIYVGIKKNYNYSILQILATSLSIVMVMKVRHNGLPIGALMLAIIVLLIFFKGKSIKKAIIFILSFTILFGIASIPSNVLNVKKDLNTESAFTGEAVYYMGAILNSDVNIEEQDKEFLNNILPLDIWKEVYDPYSGVPTLFNEKYDKSFLNNNADEFMSIFKKYAKQTKKEIFRHFTEVTSIIWSIDERDGFMHSFCVNNGGIYEMSQGKYETIPKSETLNKLYMKIVDIIQDSKVLYHIFYRPAIPMYLSIVLIAYLMIKNKRLDYVLLAFPMLLNIGTYIFLISSPDLRYFYPNFLTCYFLILVFAGDKLKINKSVFENKEGNKGKKTLVIIPAYNEEGAIKKTITEIIKNNKNCDVLVINDGSKDKTSEIAKQTEVMVIDLPCNLGIGGAVQTGYLYALKNNYDIAIQVDGDGQHNPKYIQEMIDAIAELGYNMVIGSRFVSKTGYKQTFFRMLGINITSAIIKCITGVKIYDTTSGYRAVDKNIIKYFADNYPYDYPEPDTNMQIILKGMRIKEIPVEMNQRETGVSSISPLKSVVYMLKVSLSLILTGIRKL